MLTLLLEDDGLRPYNPKDFDLDLLGGGGSISGLSKFLLSVRKFNSHSSTGIRCLFSDPNKACRMRLV